MTSKEVKELETRLKKLESTLKSGFRSESAMGKFPLDDLDKQNLQREIKDIKAELNAEYNRTSKKGNTLGLALSGETEETETDTDTTPQKGNKTPKKAKDNSKPENNNNSKDKPKLVKRKGPSYSDDMTQSDYGLREKVRIRDKAEEENIGEAAAEANLKKGGTVRKAKPAKYGMKHGGFTKRGGMYKKGMS
jgi:hypothetical protein